MLWIQQMGGVEVSLNSDWQNFLNESLDEKTIFTYIQGLEEIISNLKPRTMTEKRRMSLAKQHIKEVKRYARRMQNEAYVLQEKLNVLEESKGDE
jgi:RNA-splicing ligase RtcB